MSARKLYFYIGAADLKQLIGPQAPRTRVATEEDVLQWVRNSKPVKGADGAVTATFIVDTSGALWIADRHSEHVVCARGEPILSAGEMSFAFDKGKVSVCRVSNQSTGYCPEPETWPVMESVLHDLGISHPNGFTTEFVFRRCCCCGASNIVKEGDFECLVCGDNLDATWNF